MPQVALDGIRVLELSDGIAAPYCCKMFSDYGADVVRVDTLDSSPTSTLNDDNVEEVALYLHLNANKRSVALDLESERGRGLLRDLALQCDAVVESMSPGVAEGLGIGYETLSAQRPDIVMTSVTPFGQNGPYRGWSYTELTVFAMTGAMNREGLPNRYPLKYGGEIAQYFAGTAAAAATMAALTGATFSGVGDWIDISIMEVMAGHPHQIGRRAPFAYSGEVDRRTEPRTSSAGGREPYAVGTFRCKDGYVSFLPLGSRMWPNISEMIGQPELQRDPRFSTPEGRTENRHELEEIFQSWLDAHTRMEVFDAAQEGGTAGRPRSALARDGGERTLQGARLLPGHSSSGLRASLAHGPARQTQGIAEKRVHRGPRKRRGQRGSPDGVRGPVRSGYKRVGRERGGTEWIASSRICGARCRAFARWNWPRYGPAPSVACCSATWARRS